ncbi:hypothetical protein niasHT_030937 [Heterodera trifolii]|uniref:Glutathione synthetase n=1 Tax=Heterodera trifolii TaxID=157864 RepID=A0ABD2J8K5_9BILA
MNFLLFITIIFTFAKIAKSNAVLNYVEEAFSSRYEVQKLANYAIDWAFNNGMILRYDIRHNFIAQFSPVSLLPSPFPREAFEKAIAVQEAMQLLYFRVACDLDFLLDAYKDVVKTDKHIRQLVDILREVKEQGIRQPKTLMIMRSDYMLNTVKSSKKDGKDRYEIKQIEANTGAITGLRIDRRTTELHQRLLKRIGRDPTNAPQNEGDTNLINSLFMAWESFGNSDALFVILSANWNKYKFELRNIEDELERLSGGKLRVEYVPLLEGYTNFSLADDNSLLLNGKIVGIVYSGLSALGYQANEKEMHTRKIVELSTAIKAPSLAIGISSSKKIQQLLASPGILERFFPDPAEADKVKAIRETFTGLWGLEKNDEQTERLIAGAIEHPSNYVLKPNGECGGNNYYDERLREKLLTMTREERSAHILMQKLHPMTTKNYFLRPFYAPKFGLVVSELGVYGTLMGDLLTRDVSSNVQRGHLLRTKSAGVNEGGIGVGTAQLLVKFRLAKVRPIDRLRAVAPGHHSSPVLLQTWPSRVGQASQLGRTPKAFSDRGSPWPGKFK